MMQRARHMQAPLASWCTTILLTLLLASAGWAQEHARPIETQRVSMYKAVLLSALVPGLGEYWSGHADRALVFAAFEGAVWTSFATFRVQESLRNRRAIEYAVAFAGAPPGGDDQYYKAVGQFMRSDGPGMWNEFVRRRSRDLGESVGREYTGDQAWGWTSQERFIDYRNLRRRKLVAGDRATNALAFALINRIASIVDVVQAVHAGASGPRESGFGLKLRLGTSPDEPLARVGLWNRF